VFFAMPIKFRCPHCRQFLGISPSKAGELTDCPACGRTVRVPNLDGTVAPLPGTRIDPRDSQLAEALSALSQIGLPATREAATSAAVVAPAAVAAPPRSVTPAAVAMPVQPPLPAERVAPAPAAPSSHDVVPELLFDPEPAGEEPMRPRRQRQRTNELQIAAAVLAAVAVFLAGFFTGRGIERSKEGAAVNPAPQPQLAVPAVPVPTPAAESPQAPVAAAAVIKGVAGTVTWQTADGQSRGDGGARILAFPVKRPVSPPLAVAGFRAGTVPTERERAISAIRTAGGDYAIADNAGRFSLQLAAGRYDVLFLSRHQSRDSAESLDSSVSDLLTAYFDQPSGLVGSVAVTLVPAEFDGTSLRLDHAFAR
jgi:hypothetical protein